MQPTFELLDEGAQGEEIRAVLVDEILDALHGDGDDVHRGRLTRVHAGLLLRVTYQIFNLRERLERRLVREDTACLVSAKSSTARRMVPITSRSGVTGSSFLLKSYPARSWMIPVELTLNLTPPRCRP